MTRLEKFILQPTSKVDEMVYHGNIGFEELVKFYQTANQRDIDKMEEIIRDEDWNGFKMMIQRVLKVSLK